MTSENYCQKGAHLQMAPEIQTADTYEILRWLRKKGFVQTIDMQDNFDNLSENRQPYILTKR